MLIDEPFFDPDAGGPVPAGQPRLGGFPLGTLDLVFAVHKSVSCYYAALRSAKRYPDADTVVEAHQEGVHWALRRLNHEGAWARNEAAYDSTTGLTTVQVTHIASEHTTTRKDGGEHPHIHTHVFVFPEVTSTKDGKPHRLDSRSLERALPAAAAIHNRNMTEFLMRALPVEFGNRQGHRDRLILGVPDKLIATFPHSTCSMRKVSGMARQILVTTPPELCHWLGDQSMDDVQDAAARMPRT